LARILITGGYGYLGGRLAQALQSDKNEIFLGSRVLKSIPDWLPNCISLEVDFKKSISLVNACKNMDVVIHASGMSAIECASSPVSALECNGLYTARLAEAAAETKVKKFIYLSTAHVYAGILEGTIDENTSPKNLHPYASSHLAGEKSLLYIISQKKIKGGVLRISNAFGHPANIDNKECWKLVVNEFCKAAVERRIIRIKNGGGNLRDFVPIDLLIGVVKSIINSKFSCGENNIVNLGLGESLSIIELAEIIRERCYKLYNYKPLIIGINKKKAHVKKLKFKTIHNELIKRQNEVSLGEQVDTLLKYCMNNFKYKAGM